MNPLAKLEALDALGKLPPKFGSILKKFYISYQEAAQQNGFTPAQCDAVFDMYYKLILEQIEHPFTFEPYHERIRSPFDYYTFGQQFIRTIVRMESSTIRGEDNLINMEKQLAQGDNVILLANHQTEPDPQAISLLLEKKHPKMAEEMIFVAGHRVITDPLAVPISKGCNLICIFSKKYIEQPPEQKQDKLTHNKKTMKRLEQLLSQGGKCIYVAPSGGRDRANKEGVVEVAPFDPQSIEMFWLIASKAEKKTHFYPLALATYDLLPPPSSVDVELGERRHAQCTPIHIAFGKEIDMENYPGSDLADKKQRRTKRAEMIWNMVKKDYDMFSGRSPG